VEELGFAMLVDAFFDAAEPLISPTDPRTEVFRTLKSGRGRATDE